MYRMYWGSTKSNPRARRVPRARHVRSRPGSRILGAERSGAGGPSDPTDRHMHTSDIVCVFTCTAPRDFRYIARVACGCARFYIFYHPISAFRTRTVRRTRRDERERTGRRRRREPNAVAPDRIGGLARCRVQLQGAARRAGVGCAYSTSGLKLEFKTGNFVQHSHLSEMSRMCGCCMSTRDGSVGHDVMPTCRLFDRLSARRARASSNRQHDLSRCSVDSPTTSQIARPRAAREALDSDERPPRLSLCSHTSTRARSLLVVRLPCRFTRNWYSYLRLC